MDCPACKNVKLVLAERQSIEIDYCPNCRGVWLDRGELDKIIDRSAVAAPAAAPAAPPPAAAPYGGQEYAAPPRPAYPANQHHGDQHHPHYKKKRREGFLGELFDFD